MDDNVVYGAVSLLTDSAKISAYDMYIKHSNEIT